MKGSSRCQRSPQTVCVQRSPHAVSPTQQRLWTGTGSDWRGGDASGSISKSKFVRLDLEDKLSGLLGTMDIRVQGPSNPLVE